MFRDINGYPNWITEQTIKKVKNQNEMIRSTVVTTNTEPCPDLDCDAIYQYTYTNIYIYIYIYIAEALQIKHERPSLNVQEQSLPIKLFG